jgi:hypothetical protein
MVLQPLRDSNPHLPDLTGTLSQGGIYPHLHQAAGE